MNGILIFLALLLWPPTGRAADTVANQPAPSIGVPIELPTNSSPPFPNRVVLP